jgi:hypothetical protein
MDLMHLDEEQLQRVIHGELRPEVAAAVHGHLGGCPECRTRLEQAEREEAWVLERLTRVDHPPPRASVAAIIDRSTGRRRSRARLAAGLALALGAAGVAYAAPGSPLPAALDRLGDLIAPSRRSSPATTAPAPAVSQAGIAVDPGQRLTVSFQSGSITDTAFISLTNDAELVIRAVGGSAGFDSKTDRLLIRHTGPTNFEILIPRSAPLIEVRSGERRLLLKQGERLRAVVDPQGGGRYVIPLTPARGE